MSENTVENDAPFRVEPERRNFSGGTGFYVRALDGEKWVNADIGQLDADSLYRFLRSRGGDNPWAESIVLGMLGHDHTVIPSAKTRSDRGTTDARNIAATILLIVAFSPMFAARWLGPWLTGGLVVCLAVVWVAAMVCMAGGGLRDRLDELAPTLTEGGEER